jgi:dihydrofolate reductase
MTKLRVANFSISLDGYGAGPNQTRDTPLGEGGEDLHGHVIRTRTFTELYGQGGGETGPDDDFVARSFVNLGAWIMGRNMFGPIRGDWPDDSWKGWWGDNPPYHVPVYVLTHYPRDPISMDGGTTFHFVTDGIESALQQAKTAAGDKDIRLGGGVSVIRQHLQAGLLDELHLAISPVILGSGEHLFTGINLQELGFVLSEHVTSPNATHIVLTKQQ